MENWMKNIFIHVNNYEGKIIWKYEKRKLLPSFTVQSEKKNLKNEHKMSNQDMSY